MVRAKHSGPFSQNQTETLDAFFGPPRGQQRSGQLLPDRERIRVTWAELPATLLGELAPIGDRRAGQPGAVQALADVQEQRMASARPECVAGGPQQARGTRSQHSCEADRLVRAWPGLHQCVGRGQRSPVQRRWCRSTDRLLGCCTQPDQRLPSGFVHRDEVVARGSGPDERCGESVAVEQRSHLEQATRGAGRRDPVSVFRR